MILPFRHNVDVIGANGASLDASSYIDHFKERVAIGLGVAPHHLGMSMAGGNRSMSERLDTALYDKIKQFQKQFAEMVRVHILNELLFEGGFDPLVNPYESSVSDRCFFKFNEIDVDTQVKKETHIIQKYVSSLITLTEARTQLNIDPEVELGELYNSIQGKVQIDIAKAQSEIQSKAQAKLAKVNQDQQPVDVAKDGDKQQSAPKGQTNPTSSRRGAGNVMRPQNQSGRRTSPNIKRSDNAWLGLVENLLEEQYNIVVVDELIEETKVQKQETTINEDKQ